MIHRAKFQNFKALRDVEVTFDSRLTVLVGPNGCGKTSVLEGVKLVGGLANGKRAEAVFRGKYKLPNVYSRTASGPLVLDVETPNCDQPSGDNDGAQIRLSASRDPADPTVWDYQRNIIVYGVARPVVSAADEKRLAPFRTTSLLQFDPAQLAAPSVQAKSPPTISSNGRGLASTLAYLQLTRPEAISQITEHLRRVIPNVVRLRFDREANRVNGVQDTFSIDFRNASGIIAPLTSQGTLLILGLLVALTGPDTATTVLIDDLERGLHPKAQLDLIGLLRQLLAERPDLQIIATSHSPYILDRLEPSEVRVMNLRNDGSAVCARLADHPEFDRWKLAMSPGEFWSTFYENWLSREPQLQPTP